MSVDVRTMKALTAFDRSIRFDSIERIGSSLSDAFPSSSSRIMASEHASPPSFDDDVAMANDRGGSSSALDASAGSRSASLGDLVASAEDANANANANANATGDEFGDFTRANASEGAIDRGTTESARLVESATDADGRAAFAAKSEALSEDAFSSSTESVRAQDHGLNSYNSPHLQAFRAKQAKALDEKAEAERLEIERIKEEARAELELMNSQRAKVIDAAKATNRELQTAEEELLASTAGWEAVASLVSDENLVPGSLTDLSKMRSLLRQLKNTPPAHAA